MEEVLMGFVQSQGIWAALFVFLLLYTIRKNDKLDELQEAREEKYQNLLMELTDRFTVVTAVNEKLDQLCSACGNENKG